MLHLAKGVRVLGNLHTNNSLPAAQLQLLDSLFGTERGLKVSSELRAEIMELISQLEARNPHPSPTEVSVLS